MRPALIIVGVSQRVSSSAQAAIGWLLATRTKAAMPANLENRLCINTSQ
jgi:hypothetical protein